MPHKAFSPGTALFRFIVPKRDDLIGVLKPAHGHCIDNIFGLPLLGDDAFAKSFGFAREDFIRIRAALMAYADSCLGMADAAEMLSVRAFPRFRCGARKGGKRMSVPLPE